MSIDTYDLSKKTYKAVLIEAEKFDHNLTLHFGLLADHCADEAEYIKNADLLVDKMLRMDDNDIDDLFFGEPPKKVDFHAALNKIKKNISSL